MMIFGIVFIIMVLAVAGMAVGVLAGRKALEGSCGGLKTIQGLECMVCPTPCETQELGESHGFQDYTASQSMNSGHDDLVHKACPHKKTLSPQPLAIERILCN